VLVTIQPRQIIRRLFNEPIHLSWLLTAVGVGFLAGVGLSIMPATSTFSNSVWLLLAAFLIILVVISRLRIMIVFAVIAGLLVGLWRGVLQRVDLTGYEPFLNQTVKLRGRIAEDPDYASGGDLRLKLTAVAVSKDGAALQSLPGTVWASILGHNYDIKRGDTVEINDRLRPGFGTFPASFSFASLTAIEPATEVNPALELRDYFGQGLRSVIGAPAADLGMGILAGQKTALPADLTAAFMAASLTHIVVASGYNLTILIRFARRLFAKISRWAALGFGGLLVVAFAGVTGFSPSMTRASLVVGLSLASWYFGRRFHPIVLLVLAAAITIALNPIQIWGDAGWYLSFLSFAGILLLAPLIKDYFWGQDKVLAVPVASKLWHKVRRRYFAKQNFVDPMPSARPFNLRQIFIETLSAQIMAAPIIALIMGNFSPYGMIANILVLPILPLAMLLSFIGGLAGLFLPTAIAAVIAWPAEQLLNYIIWIAERVAALPGASQQLDLGPWAYIGLLGLISLCMIYMKVKTKHNFASDDVLK
jgi:competence protein ComEC